MADNLTSHCFKDGNCLDPEMRPFSSCPTMRRTLETYFERSPLLLSEDLCLAALMSTGRSKMKDPFKDLCADIEFDLDHAIALPHGHVGAAKEALFNQIIAQMKEAQSEKDIFSKSRLQYYLRLRQLGLFMPALRSRIANETLDGSSMLQTHISICSTLSTYDKDYLYPLPRAAHQDKKIVIANRTEIEVQGLLTRLRAKDRFPYPSLKREEASQARSEHNHDFYVIEMGQKIPIQVKNTKSDSGYQKVVVIRHYDVLHAMRREERSHTSRWTPGATHDDYEWPSQYSYEQIVEGTKPDPIGHLLVEEMEQGRYFDPAKLSMLNLASQYVLSRIDQYSNAHIAK